MVYPKMIKISQHKIAGPAAKPIAALIISSSILSGCNPHAAMMAPQPARVYFSHATDNQRKIDLSKQLSPATATLEQEVSEGRLPEIVLRFDNDSSKVRTEDVERLQSFLLSFGDEEMPTFIITGHTDSNHSAQYNDGLSQRRARATQLQMQKMGVPISHTLLRSYGETMPDAENTSAAGRQINRRVTVSIFANG